MRLSQPNVALSPAQRDAERVKQNMEHARLEAELEAAALGGDPPMLAINPRSTVSEKSKQSGFANLVKGTSGMFRNPTAHEARIHWAMTRRAAAAPMPVPPPVTSATFLAKRPGLVSLAVAPLSQPLIVNCRATDRGRSGKA